MNGIIILAVLSAVLLVIFRAETHALIPLYAVGVFISFTLSQAGMVRYWLRERGRRWLARATLNGAGAAATGVVTLIVASTKFTHGAWMVVVLIPCVVLVAIHRHYTEVARQLSIKGLEPQSPPPPLHLVLVLVLVGDVHRGVLPAVEYARSLSSSARGVYVELDHEASRRLEDRWAKLAGGIPLVVLRSPYRSVVRAIVEYVDRLKEQVPNLLITIVLPEFVPARWWQYLLHNQTALLIKGALLLRRGVIVTDVPYHLAR